MAYNIPYCLPISGGTMQGLINMGGFALTNVLDPVNSQDAATRNYVDTHGAGSYLPLTGGALTGNVTNTGRYLFQTSSFSTTMSQSGILANIVGMSSAFSGAYVIPATGSAFTVASYQGTSTVPTNVSQTISAGTACTVYYYPGTALDSTGTGSLAPALLFNGVRYLTMGGSSLSYLKSSASLCAPSLSISNGLGTVPNNSSNQTASQSGVTVTGVGTSWDSTYKGRMIRFATGQTAWITSVASTTSMTVTPSQTVAATAFDIPGKTNSSEATSMDSAGNFGTNNCYVNGTLNLPNGTLTTAANVIFAGAFATTITATAISNATLPAGTTTLVPTTGTGATGTWGISVSGNAATVTTNANLTGDVTSSGNATTYNAIVPISKGGTGANNAAVAGTLLRGDGTTFVPTTTTYPDTIAINALLYASSANVMSALSLGNSKILASNSSGLIAGRSFSVVVQVITSTGTYTPTTGMQYVQMELVGGGGGGGGCASTGASQFAGAAGGSGGECAVGIFSAVTVGASQAVTIGAAGSAGSAGNNSGGNGGATSVGALISAGGGFGGGGDAAQSTGSTVLGPSGGGVINPGSGGSYRFSGGNGGIGIVSPVANIINGGAGGASRFSGGGGATLNGAGFAAVGYGGGGSGASRTASAAAAAGGAGTAGAVVFTEFVVN